MRRTIFLGSANALAIPMPRLIAMLEQLRRIFPVQAERGGPGFAGIDAFLDGFTGLRKTIGDEDRGYLSDFVEIPGTPYRALAEAQGIRPLPPAARRAQAEAIRAGLQRPGGDGPRVAPYALEAFLY